MAVKSCLFYFAVIISMSIAATNFIEIRKTKDTEAVVKGHVRYHIRTTPTTTTTTYEYVDDRQITLLPGCRLISETGQQFKFVGGKGKKKKSWFATKKLWEYKSKDSDKGALIDQKEANLMIEAFSGQEMKNGHYIVWKVEGRFAGIKKPHIKGVTATVTRDASSDRETRVTRGYADAPKIVAPPNIDFVFDERIKGIDPTAAHWIDSYFTLLIKYLETAGCEQMGIFLEDMIQLSKDYAKVASKEPGAKTEKDIVRKMEEIYKTVEEKINLPWGARDRLDKLKERGWRTITKPVHIATPWDGEWRSVTTVVKNDVKVHMRAFRLSDIYLKWLLSTKEGENYIENGDAYRRATMPGTPVVPLSGKIRVIYPPKTALVFNKLCEPIEPAIKDRSWYFSYWYDQLMPFLEGQPEPYRAYAKLLQAMIKYFKEEPEKREIFTVVDTSMSKIDNEQLAAFERSDGYQSWLSTGDGVLYKRFVEESSAVHQGLFDLYEDETDWGARDPDFMWTLRKQMNNLGRIDALLINGVYILLSFLGVLCAFVIFCGVFVVGLLCAIMSRKYYKESNQRR